MQVGVPSRRTRFSGSIRVSSTSPLAGSFAQAVSTMSAGTSAVGRGVSVPVTHRDLAPMFDHRTQLMSIVANLIDNACRFAATSVSASIVTAGGGPSSR